MAGEERTKQVFGDYVSIYNFKQSIDDGNTVPLYYENRIPELQLKNPNLTEDMAEIVDNAELDEDQQRKLERDFASSECGCSTSFSGCSSLSLLLRPPIVFHNSHHASPFGRLRLQPLQQHLGKVCYSSSVLYSDVRAQVSGCPQGFK